MLEVYGAPRVGETQEPGLRKHWCQETPGFSGAGAKGHLLSESTPTLPCPWVPPLRVTFVGQGASHWPHMDPGLDGGWQSEGLSHQDGIPRGRIDLRGGPSTLAKPVHSSVWGWVSLSWGLPEMSQNPLFKLYQLKVFSVAGTENPTK